MPNLGRPHTCPVCGYRVDQFDAIEWGDGVQRVKVEPFLCSGCGEASIINLVTMIIERVPPEGWAIVRLQNPELMDRIEESQRLIREYRQQHKVVN